MELSEAKNILNECGYILEDTTAKFNEGIRPVDKIYTGLPDKISYHNIIESVRGQIYDGIGEGGGRTGRIFNYYFKTLIDDYDVHCTSENGEFVVTGNSIDDVDGIELLVNCIWRIASIERKDRKTTDKDILYEYLKYASWSDICKLCGALTTIRKKGGQTEPWSDEKKDKYEAIKKAEEEKRIAEEEARKKAEEEQKQKELVAKNEREKIVATYTTDAKDKQRAEDAFRSCRSDIHLYYVALSRQLNRITDTYKYKRRIAAFYQYAINLPDNTWINNSSSKEYYLDRMIRMF